MRLVIQRVLESSVKVEGREVGRIGKGFMVLCGVEDGDTAEDVRYCVDKTVNLRVFEDENDKMNRSLADVGGGLLKFWRYLNLRYMAMCATAVVQALFARRDPNWPYRCMMHTVRDFATRVFMWKPVFFKRI